MFIATTTKKVASFLEEDGGMLLVRMVHFKMYFYCFLKLGNIDIHSKISDKKTRVC